MSFTTLFIRQPRSWDDLSRALRALTRDAATDVKFIGSDEPRSADSQVINVVVMKLHGMAEYCLEIYWKGTCDLAPDAVGMYIATAVNCDVIIEAEPQNPGIRTLLTPSGTIHDIDLDAEQLSETSHVEYKVL